jgi:hypothetical protein
MQGGGFWKLVLAIIVAYLAIRLILFVIGIAMNLLWGAVTLAIVVGVIWLLFQIFGGGKRNAY